MCNEQRFSESGAPMGAVRCRDYIAIQSDRDRLAGVLAGMEEQNTRNLDALRRAEAENARLREALKFYANPKKHRLKGEWQHGYPGGIEYQDGNHSMLDTGQIASSALKEVG